MKKGEKMSEESRRKMSELKKGKPSPRKGIRSPNIKGKYFDCAICGQSFYRSPGQIADCKGTLPKTCSRACNAVVLSGHGNPFWNKKHSLETRAKMSLAKKGKPSPQKGLPGKIPNAETRRKLSAVMKQRWEEHRDEMIARLPKGSRYPYYKSPGLKRHRKQFTPRQRREWTEKECAYCGDIENLILDHIIPIFDGGYNHRANAQTLCQPCNLWKTYSVDLPRYHAALALQRG